MSVCDLRGGYWRRDRLRTCFGIPDTSVVFIFRSYQAIQCKTIRDLLSPLCISCAHNFRFWTRDEVVYLSQFHFYLQMVFSISFLSNKFLHFFLIILHQTGTGLLSEELMNNHEEGQHSPLPSLQARVCAPSQAMLWIEPFPLLLPRNTNTIKALY